MGSRHVSIHHKDKDKADPVLKAVLAARPFALSSCRIVEVAQKLVEGETMLGSEKVGWESALHQDRYFTFKDSRYIRQLPLHSSIVELLSVYSNNYPYTPYNHLSIPGIYYALT